MPDAGYTIAKFTIIAPNFHFNVLKYMIFVTKVVVNLVFEDGEFNIRILKSFIGSIARLAFSYIILIYNILTTEDCMWIHTCVP